MVSKFQDGNCSLRSPYHSVNQTTHCVTRGTRAFPTGSGLEYRTEFALFVTQTYNKIESEDCRKLVPLLRGSDCLIPLPNPQSCCLDGSPQIALYKLGLRFELDNTALSTIMRNKAGLSW